MGDGVGWRGWEMGVGGGDGEVGKKITLGGAKS